MLVMVDDRSLVTAGYEDGFRGEGVSTIGFGPDEFREWITCAAEADLSAVEAFLLGDCRERALCAKAIRERSRAPIIAMNETQSLEQTLALFAAGVDDVVRKPVHVRELLARVGAIRRRVDVEPDFAVLGDMRVYFDGRDPEVGGEVLSLPRRERRILEYLIRNRGRRVSKTQIFNSIYGIFDENVEENVVESHVSKLRKKLRRHLGMIRSIPNDILAIASIRRQTTGLLDPGPGAERGGLRHQMMRRRFAEAAAGLRLGTRLRAAESATGSPKADPGASILLDCVTHLG